MTHFANHSNSIWNVRTHHFSIHDENLLVVPRNLVCFTPTSAVAVEVVKVV